MFNEKYVAVSSVLWIQPIMSYHHLDLYAETLVEFMKMIKQFQYRQSQNTK